MSLSTIANKINRLAPGLQPDYVKSIINDSYVVLGREAWNRLRIVYNFVTVAPYTTGTVAVDSDGTVTVTTGVVTDAMLYRWMRVEYSDALFKISAVDTDANTLTLEDWTGATVAAGETFTIYQHTYELASDIGVITDVVYQSSLPKRSQAYFNRMDPGRLSTGTPTYWALAEEGANGYHQIEIYPIPDALYPIRVYARKKIAELGDSDSPLIPEDVVEAHATINCLRLKATLEPTGPWSARLSEQMQLYSALYENARYEDYLLGAHRGRVRDVTSEPIYPSSDSFYAAHDVE